MTDYIDREAAEEIFACGKENWKDYEAGACIAALPAADVAPVVHGEWKFSIWHGRRLCSVCKCETDESGEYNPYQYCPRCGARMDGAE